MARWFFRRQDGSSQTVRYGELIAMGYGTARSFYKYAVTEVGINLENTGTPSYEWRLVGDPGSAGQIVRTGERLAIWNDAVRGFTIYADRHAGFDVPWFPGEPAFHGYDRPDFKGMRVPAENWMKSYVSGASRQRWEGHLFGPMPGPTANRRERGSTT